MLLPEMSYNPSPIRQFLAALAFKLHLDKLAFMVLQARFGDQPVWRLPLVRVQEDGETAIAIFFDDDNEPLDLSDPKIQ